MLRQLGLILLVSATAGAHSRLTSPVPRNQFDDIKMTSAVHPPPCGGPRSTVVMSKQVGDSILVEWDETIDHPGHYEILFSMASDLSFAFLTDPAGAMLNNIPDVQGGTLPHHYTQMVKLPATACPACTLQVKQFMEGEGYYFSCADMEIRALAVPGVDGGTPPPEAPPDLATAPQAQPSAPPDPSTAPEAPAEAAPDMAVAKTPQSGALEIDYSYGCSASRGAATTLFPLLLLLSALGTARIGWRYRSRRSGG